MKNKRKAGYKGWEKDLATWVHRYLRLHSHLTVDPLYEDMYQTFRLALIKSLQKDLRYHGATEGELETLLDTSADIFNRENAELVNQYKPVVDELRRVWNENTNPFDL
ncbi:MAG: hypothetical protein E7381_04650 [Clostridiales bacterium]|nr:hypothetical protein [Clostridiales bacterium]